MPSFTIVPHRVSTRFTDPLVSPLAAIGVTPNIISIAGFLGNVAAAALAAGGMFIAAGSVMLFFSALDLLDGALARKTGTVTKFGAVFDSVLDRLSEAAVLGGLLFHFSQEGGHTMEIALCYAAVVGSIMVSYVRARAEGIGLELREGLFTRAERVDPARGRPDPRPDHSRRHRAGRVVDPGVAVAVHSVPACVLGVAEAAGRAGGVTTATFEEEAPSLADDPRPDTLSRILNFDFAAPLAFLGLAIAYAASRIPFLNGGYGTDPDAWAGACAERLLAVGSPRILSVSPSGLPESMNWPVPLSSRVAGSRRTD